MARRLLGSDQVEPQAIRFGLHDHGKPYVTEPAPARLPFNIAHTDGLVMCGIGSDVHELVGIDVERIHRRTDPELANRYFSQPEIEFLQSRASESERRMLFLRIWTLKESFIKAIGTGLQTPLADFAFEEIESATPRIRMLHPALESNVVWNFYSIEPRPGFIGAIAVASKSAENEIGFELHDFERLVAPVESGSLPRRQACGLNGKVGR